MGYGGGEPSDSGRELGSECGSVGVAGVLVVTDVGETARSDVYDVVHALNPRAGGWESFGHPSVWSASKGLRRADGTHESFPFERGRRLRRSGQTFHYSGAARSMRNGRADEHDDRISTEHSEFQETSIGSDGRGHLHDSDGSKMLNTILTVLGSSRGRTTRRILSGWWGRFDGRAYLCASEHVRGVASDEVDRFGLDEGRQENELLDYEDSTFPSRLPSSAEISTEPPKELEDSFRDDLDINMDTRRVVCVSVRKILEKLKSLCSLRRLHMAPVAEAGEAASSTREQGRALSAENDAGARGTFDDTWQGGPKDAAPFWHDEGGPDRWASAVVDEMGATEKAS